uniref:Uncharacterized protein n=1 Tax=Panagrolaimus davidi TaxID=227884 RepID=A0A914QI66_9BILA
MASIKENIVVVQFPGFSHACLFSICYPTSQHKQIFLPVTDLFKDPSKCFEFFEKLASLVPVKLIKGLVLLAKVPFPLNVIQKVKRNFQKFCESYGIFYYFPTTDMINDYEMLRDIKPNIANGDYVAIVNPLEDVNFRVLKRTGRYIAFQEESLIPISSLAAFKTSVMAKYNLKQLLFIKCSEGNRLETLMRDTGEEVIKAFPDVPIAYNAAPDPHHRLNMTIESCIELLLLEMGEKAGSRYVTKPFFDRDIEISSTLIKCKYGDLLPFEMSVIQKVADAKNLTLREPKCGLLENIAFISTDAKEVKITLSVDTNMFYKVRVQPVTETPKEEIIALSFEKNIKIKDAVGRMAKIVFAHDHFSIYVMEDGEEEKITVSFLPLFCPVKADFAGKCRRGVILVSKCSLRLPE